MSSSPVPSTRGLDEETALRTILEGTATETGERFFFSLVENLAKVLQTHGAWVTEYFPESQRIKALAFWLDGNWLPDWEMNLAGTPCEEVFKKAQLIHFPDNLLNLYPTNPNVVGLQAVSYLGMPLTDLEGKILGHLAVLDTRPMPEEPRLHTLFRIFADRAAAELRRLRAEMLLKEREEKLGRLVDSAMDAIIELNKEFVITRMNPAAEKVFQSSIEEMVGREFLHYVSPNDQTKLRKLVKELDIRPLGERYLWIPGGLQALRRGGEPFPAEATLSRFEMQRRPFYTVILRNVNERLEAERKIRFLTIEAENLREELQTVDKFRDIIGRSQPMVRVLQDIQQVAETDSTVLILGETGTGKEVVARCIHAASHRQDAPLIKVNCAAIPGNLIESELFGHEKGAFTGATTKREGRFTLADGGTIFLDEVGELPLDLQTKLLRVLQESEFEPVGSSTTRKVNVRILAATNRDLSRAVRQRHFREDLYYRLHVFPIHVPPLRERQEDIEDLAPAFLQRFAQRMGKPVRPFTRECLARLKSYPWPGNVRELQNVIERAVITAIDGIPNLEKALPEGEKKDWSGSGSSLIQTPKRIKTMEELQVLEKENILHALEATGWRVAGENGAAQLLGMNPSTLSSRIRALGITRPDKAIL